MAINALDGEGIHLLGPVVRVINDDYLVVITAIPARDPVLRGRQGPPLALGEGLVAYPYTGTGILLSDMSELTLATDRVRYVVYPKSTRSEGAIVGSSAFNGSASDRTILSRLRFAAAGEASCVRPLSFTFAPFGDAAAAEKAGFESYGIGRSIALYPPMPFAGPGYHCQGAVGFRVEPGESLLRPWKPLGDGTSYLTRNGTSITISGPSTPMVRLDPQDRDEHPMGLLHETRIIYYKNRGVGQPYAEPGVREDGSWSIELGRDSNSRLDIAFPTSEKMPVGFRFLERLEIRQQG